jgi:PAS domain S-box-containing protein
MLDLAGGKVGLWDWDIVTNEVKWTAAIFMIHGVDPATFQVTLDSFTNLIHPDDLSRVQTAIKQALEKDLPYELEFRIRRPDGKEAWVFTNATVIRQDGRPIRMIGATLDITARRQAENHSRWLAAIVDSSGDAIVSKDLNGTITSWNPGAQRLFGYTAREIIGRPVTVLIPAERKEEETGIIDRVRRGERTEHYETVRQRKDGTLVEVSLTVSPIKDAGGRIVGASKIARDISDRKKAQEALRTSEERFRLLANHAPVGIFLSDQKGNCVFVNERWCEMSGRTHAEAQGDGWATGLHPEDRERVVAEWCIAVEKGLPSVSEFRFKRPDGQTVWVQGSAVRFDDGGQFRGYLGSCVDITQRKQAELQTEFLHRLSDQLAGLASPERIRGAAQSALGEYLGADRCSFVEIDHARTVGIVTSEWHRPGLPRVPGQYRLADYGSPELRAQITRPQNSITDVNEHPATREHRREFDALRIRSLATSAFWQEGLWVFSLIVTCREPRAWTAGELDLIENVAARVGPIIERARASQALHESEKLHRLLLAGLPVACYTLDAEGRLVFFNEAAAELWGRRPVLGEELWTGAYEMVELDGRSMPLDHCPAAMALKSGSPVRDHEAYVIRPDGSRRWVVPHPTPLYGSDGRCTGLVNVIIDVTEQRAAQQIVEQRERQLRLVTDHAPIFLAHVDRDHRFKFVNLPYAERYGRTREDIIGRHVSELTGPIAYETFQHHMEGALAGRRIEFEQEIPYITLGLRWVHVIYEPERTAGGEVVGLVAVIVDITARKQVELDLERARDDAMAASRAKDDFLAALSHELRTPLNPVLLLASDAANNTALPREIRDNFETVRRNISLEARLIDDLLDLTRITRGKLQLEKQPVDVHAVLRDAVNNLRADIDAKHLNLQLFLGATNPLTPGDPVRLQQVFWNILKNAVKFTHEAGQICVVTRIAAGADNLTVEITDNGIGMTPAELEGVFEAFTQGEHAGSAHTFGGIGLGLAISRKLVEMHDGRITAASPGRNRGSVFVIELPLAPAGGARSKPAAAGSNPAEPAVTARPGSILLVEDHVSTRETLQKLLARRNYDVVAAGTVAEALAHATARPFDILVSDVGLPDGDGYQLMEKIRIIQPTLQGIALSGYGMEDDVQRSLAGGFSNHLVKPVSISSLERALARLNQPVATS